MNHPTRPPLPFTFVLLGAGTVGTALAKLLVDAGHKAVAVASRSSSSLERARALLDAREFEIGEEVPTCDIVLLGVPGPALPEVADQLASSEIAGKVVWHLSGVDGTGALASVTDAGAIPVAVHPVQACPDLEKALDRLPGSAWGITATQEETISWCGRVVRESLGGHPVVVAEEDRGVWHAAAATVSNGIAALLAAGESMLGPIGIREPIEVLGPLADGTVQNAREGGGGAETLTGPVVRGDAATIALHQRALARTSHGDAYRQTALLILEQAIRSGRLDESAAIALHDLLLDPR